MTSYGVRYLVGGFVMVAACLMAAAGPAHAQDPRDVWLTLLESGQIEEGRDQLVTYAGGLPPVEATKILRWVEAISMTEGADQAAVVQAIVRAQRGQSDEAIAGLTAHIGERDDDSAPVLLSLAIHVAEAAGDAGGANALRARLVSDFAGHAVAPEALLELAEYQLATGEPLVGTADAVEALIVDQPTHPLVPTARRLLARLREAGGVS